MTADQLPGPHMEGTLLQQGDGQAEKEVEKEVGREASPAPEQSAEDAGIESCPGEADAESRQASSISPLGSPYTPPGSPPRIAPLAGMDPESSAETEPTSVTSSVRTSPYREGPSPPMLPPPFSSNALPRIRPVCDSHKMLSHYLGRARAAGE